MKKINIGFSKTLILGLTVCVVGAGYLFILKRNQSQALTPPISSSKKYYLTNCKQVYAKKDAFGQSFSSIGSLQIFKDGKYDGLQTSQPYNDVKSCVDAKIKFSGNYSCGNVQGNSSQMQVPVLIKPNVMTENGLCALDNESLAKTIKKQFPNLVSITNHSNTWYGGKIVGYAIFDLNVGLCPDAITNKVKQAAASKDPTSKYACNTGAPNNLACASFVSSVLVDSGVLPAGCYEANADEMGRKLKGMISSGKVIQVANKVPVTQTKNLQSGDVIVCEDHGPHGHIGFYSGNGNVIDTNSYKEIINERPLANSMRGCGSISAYRITSTCSVTTPSPSM